MSSAKLGTPISTISDLQPDANLRFLVNPGHGFFGRCTTFESFNVMLEWKANYHVS